MKCKTFITVYKLHTNEYLCGYLATWSVAAQSHVVPLSHWLRVRARLYRAMLKTRVSRLIGLPLPTTRGRYESFCASAAAAAAWFEWEFFSPSWLEVWKKRPCVGVSSRDKAKETKCLNLQLLSTDQRIWTAVVLICARTGKTISPNLRLGAVSTVEQGKRAQRQKPCTPSLESC